MRSWINKPATLLLLVLSFVAAPKGFAESDPNQLLSFKHLFIEPASDNVGGAFREPVDQAYREILAKNPRFALATEARQADAVIRTRLNKRAGALDVELALVLGEDAGSFTTERASVANDDQHELANVLKSLLKTALKRIPFYGTVTGRDGDDLTFDIGDQQGLKKGDIIQISRIDQVKRHPLLKSIIDVQLIPVGTAVVEQAEDSIAFGKVNSHIPGEKIERGHKVTAIEGRVSEHASPAPGASLAADPTLSRIEATSLPGAEPAGRPSIGYVGVGGFAGVFSSSTSVASGAMSYSGSAFNPGAQVSGELWLTKNWFADFNYGASTMSFSQSDASASVTDKPGVTSSTTAFTVSGGYRYLPSGSMLGPQVYAKLGYHKFSWDTTDTAADLLSSKAYSGLNLGVGGVLPLRAVPAGFLLDVNVLLFPTLTETLKTDSDPSALGVNAFFGGYYHFNPSVALRAGLQFGVYSADFRQGASSTSQTRVGFAPSLVYYF